MKFSTPCIHKVLSGDSLKYLCLVAISRDLYYFKCNKVVKALELHAELSQIIAPQITPDR